MKAYTDLNQSKKLAEILPLESADMCFNTRNNMPPLMTPYSKFNEFFGMEKTPDFLIPCWSLAALLEEIPEIINFDDDESDYELKIEKENGLYYLSYGNILEYGKLEIEPQGHFVDACVEMIIKLNEQKLW